MKDYSKAFEGLKVCPTCGWHERPYSQAHRDCHIPGQHASALLAALPGVQATLLGFGFGAAVLALYGDDRMNVRFNVNHDTRRRRPKPFSLREVYLLDNLSVDEAASLVNAITDWRAKMLTARKS